MAAVTGGREPALTPGAKTEFCNGQFSHNLAPEKQNLIGGPIEVCAFVKRFNKRTLFCLMR
jgi:hypothetical protein